MAANNQQGIVILEAYVNGGTAAPPSGYVNGNNWTFAKTGTGVFTFTTTDTYSDQENKIELDVLGTTGAPVNGHAVWTSTSVITVHTFGTDGTVATDQPFYLSVIKTRTKNSVG